MALWGRIFARVYDPFMAAVERSGMADLRRDVLSAARGRVLEIGAGTGLNLEHYPAGVEELVLTEPEEPMAARLEKRAAGARVVRASADALPFPDESFDTVVSTLVLCTVDDVEATLAEVRRVLAPEGQLLVIEHVRADEGTRLARWHDRVERPWHALACGCHTNRRTVELLERAGFDVHALARIEPGKLMPAPVVYGAVH
jgi:ubiquinone/menaquinone biosynthesis C-methylase UbiE